MISKIDTHFPVYVGELGLKEKHSLWLKRLYYDHLTLSPFSEDKKSVLYRDSDPFEGIFTKFQEASKDFFSSRPVKIKSMWTTIFEKEGFHSCHTHPQTDWTFSYYLDAEGQKGGAVRFFWEGKVLEISPKTGDFMLLPGNLPHEVTANKLSTRVLISFNLNHVT